MSAGKRSKSEYGAALAAAIAGAPGPSLSSKWLPEARAHLVDALIAHQVLNSQQLAESDAMLWREALRQRTVEAALRHAELTTLINSWRAADLHPLLLKGAP